MAKKKLQFSKIITLLLLLVITISWLRGLILFWDELDYYHYVLDYTQTMFSAIVPYCALSATDRLVYMQQAKYRGETDDGMASE